MKYRAFNSFHVGFSHKKESLDCEDYSLSYNDEDERYYIAAVCDGHSDNNCFRSSKGAKFGCEAAKEILSSFFDTYIEADMSFSDLPENATERLKQSLKQCWDNKIDVDISEFPVTDEELAPLSDRVRGYYRSGRGLKNIYGATFLAAGFCRDLFIVMHIGDGTTMCISFDGIYMVPLAYDEKSDSGEPASLCDDDLFKRENAFRCGIYNKIPIAVVLSSDGIEGSIDDILFRERVSSVLTKIASMEDETGANPELNDSQQRYLDSFVEYYAAEGHGAEDDCSFAGIYSLGNEIPEVKIPLKQAEKIFAETVNECNSVIEDYEKRKRGIVKNIDDAVEKAAKALKGSGSVADLAEAKRRIEELKQALRIIVQNEKNKIAIYEKKLDIYRTYIERVGGKTQTQQILPVEEVDASYLEEDKEYAAEVHTYEGERKKHEQEANSTQEETTAHAEDTESKDFKDEDRESVDPFVDRSKPEITGDEEEKTLLTEEQIEKNTSSEDDSDENAELQEESDTERSDDKEPDSGEDDPKKKSGILQGIKNLF